MRLGYNTNGFAHHRLDDALAILAELGYRSVALTVDHHVLDPFAANSDAEAERVRELLEKLQFRCVIETGARFLLDARRKHQPTLLDPSAEERERRLDFLRRSIDLARKLRADAVSFWSGSIGGDEPEEMLFQRLTQGCQQLADYAGEVRLAFEPEPGMFIDRMPRFEELHRRVDRKNFGLTLDVGHLQCLGELPIAPHILRWREVLWNVHIEDMRQGVHDHLPFGEGEIEFEPMIQALRQIDYRGGLHVELSRHSHNAVEVARQSLAFLRGLGFSEPEA